ncbi:hypothetical protein [Streptomyces sp. NPDC001292]|uniref:hypothetical protein n=1 Tax=Streptomyces sp. NPDC001292 TaxID=3364558 RepID=UPI0036D09CD6
MHASGASRPEERFAAEITDPRAAWRTVVATAAHRGVPAPAFSAALAYCDTLRSEHLPAALVQGPRDFQDGAPVRCLPCWSSWAGSDPGHPATGAARWPRPRPR